MIDAMSPGLGRLLMHPLRRRLLLEYAGGPDCPSRVAKRLGEPVNRVAYHTGVLLRHECIELVRTERRRGAVTRFYRSTVGPVIGDAQWAALPVSLRRELALATVDQIAEESRRASVAGGFDHADAHASRFPLELDQDGILEVVQLLHEADDALARIAAAARERSQSDSPEHEIVMLAFEPVTRPGAARS
jgi:hypothetical protein